ncbi:MAG: bifunctional folylpolyglutamate synthase/dihydrofolate synthase, partial [Parachlamydiaceae bacterium]
GPSKMGLKGMQQLCTLFGSPEKSYPTIHVAGSNGKGSVTTKIAKALELTGKKVGLYTSPHINSFRERIQINGTCISESSVASLLSNIFIGLKIHPLPVTFFEVTTLLAFRYFAEQQVDVAVIEVGLGGRLDSTNIITPILSVITSLSLEHTAILGNTLPEIAREKAGIIKPNIPVVIGPHVPIELILPFAQRTHSKCIQVQGNFPTFDAENSATAKTCLELLNVPGTAIREGCKQLPPCRLETVDLPPGKPAPKAVILDVAHNPSGIDSLFKALRLRFPNAAFRIACGLSANKEIAPCVHALRQYGNAFHLLEARNRRALPSGPLYEEFTRQGTHSSDLFVNDSLEKNLALAIELAAKAQEVLVICGTFFIMHAVRTYFEIVEPSDPSELNEMFLPSMR